jgi:hypothetical protein
MPVLRDEALMREIEEEIRQMTSAMSYGASATAQNPANNRNTTPVTAPDLILPTLNLNLIENNPPSDTEQSSDEEETFIAGMEDSLEPPSYNPVLD